MVDMYRINAENGGFKPDTSRGAADPEGCIWLETDVRGIYPTYLIVEEVSKSIEIINSRDVSVFIPSIYNFNCFLEIYGINIPQNKRNRLNY